MLERGCWGWHLPAPQLAFLSFSVLFKVIVMPKQNSSSLLGQGHLWSRWNLLATLELTAVLQLGFQQGQTSLSWTPDFQAGLPLPTKNGTVLASDMHRWKQNQPQIFTNLIFTLCLCRQRDTHWPRYYIYHWKGSPLFATSHDWHATEKIRKAKSNPHFLLLSKL